MDSIEPFEPIPSIQVLYNTLRECRPFYNANDYKWVLGIGVIAEINGKNLFLSYPDEKRTLYGIEVQVDYSNAHTIQLFEDITNKIAVDGKEEFSQ